MSEVLPNWDLAGHGILRRQGFTNSVDYWNAEDLRNAVRLGSSGAWNTETPRIREFR